MLSYLVERENEQILRTSKRCFSFPDGQTQTVEAYRVTWCWFDRIAANGAYSSEDMIELLPKWAEEKKVSLTEALPLMVECILKAHDDVHWDLTDDTLALNEGRRRIDAFNKRKSERPDH